MLRRAVELGVNFIDTDAMASRVAGSMNAFVVVRVCDASNSQNALPESREAIQPGGTGFIVSHPRTAQYPPILEFERWYVHSRELLARD